MANPLAALMEQSRHWIIDPTAPTAAEVIGSVPRLLIPLGILVRRRRRRLLVLQPRSATHRRAALTRVSTPDVAEPTLPGARSRWPPTAPPQDVTLAVVVFVALAVGSALLVGTVATPGGALVIASHRWRRRADGHAAPALRTGRPRPDRGDLVRVSRHRDVPAGDLQPGALGGVQRRGRGLLRHPLPGRPSRGGAHPAAAAGSAGPRHVPPAPASEERAARRRELAGSASATGEPCRRGRDRAGDAPAGAHAARRPHGLLLDKPLPFTAVDWDQGNLITWNWLEQRGSFPMRDFWFPYGGQWTFAVYPLGPLWNWLYELAVLGLMAWALFRLTSGRAIRVILCIAVFVVLSVWGSGLWRYGPALAPALCLAASAQSAYPASRGDIRVRARPVSPPLFWAPTSSASTALRDRPRGRRRVPPRPAALEPVGARVGDSTPCRSSPPSYSLLT